VFLLGSQEVVDSKVDVDGRHLVGTTFIFVSVWFSVFLGLMCR